MRDLDNEIFICNICQHVTRNKWNFYNIFDKPDWQLHTKTENSPFILNLIK